MEFDEVYRQPDDKVEECVEVNDHRLTQWVKLELAKKAKETLTGEQRLSKTILTRIDNSLNKRTLIEGIGEALLSARKEAIKIAVQTMDTGTLEEALNAAGKLVYWSGQFEKDKAYLMLHEKKIKLLMGGVDPDEEIDSSGKPPDDTTLSGNAAEAYRKFMP